VLAKLAKYQCAIAGKIISNKNEYRITISTGPTFAMLQHTHPEIMPKLIFVCSVYARMSPDQKALVINYAQQLDYVVAMCGDGANDCGALKVC
jgi:cation-transporting ATPase 13A2